MATSQTRRNRHRRRKAGAAVAVGASAALLAGTLTAPPAQAALLPLSIGSIGEALPGLVAACDAGDPEVSEGLLGSTADCTNASPWLLTTIADALFGVVAPDLAGLISIGGLNGALATSGLEVDLGLLGPSNVVIPGTAVISGSGYTTAITILGGEAKANADYILAGAVAVAATGGIANADALFGVGVASAIGRPATQIDLVVVDIGAPRVENSASARALPLGIAIANSSVTLGEVVTGAITNVPQWRASTVALGGITAAYRAVDGSQGAVCTAAYGEARVHKQTLDDDGNVTDSQRTNSCTSVLFIFQKQQNVGKHGGFEVYAIKNPFDIGLVSPYGDDIADLISGISGGIVDLGPLNDVLAGKFVPEFQSDIIRIVMDPAGPKVETDLFDWLGGLSTSTGLSGVLPTQTLLGTEALGMTEDPGDDDISSLSSLGDTGGDDGAGEKKSGTVVIQSEPDLPEAEINPPGDDLPAMEIGKAPKTPEIVVNDSGNDSPSLSDTSAETPESEPELEPAA